MSYHNNRILIVDDDKISLLMLKNHLLRQGYDVLCADNGQEALSFLRKQRSDLVITDYIMPGMDGLQLMHAAKTLHPAIPFILYTAQGSIESAVDAIKRLVRRICG